MTSALLDSLYSQFAAFSSESRLPQSLWWQHARALAEVDRLRAEDRQLGDRQLDSAMRILDNLETQLHGAADQRDFQCAGHSLFGILSGLVGGAVAMWFWERRKRRETHS